MFDCRLIETDAKSLNSLGGNGHSRRSSDTSQISVTSGSSNATTTAQDLSQDSQVSTSTNGVANSEEELWLLWGKIINEWEVFHKRKSSQVKVCVIDYNLIVRFLNVIRRKCFEWSKIVAIIFWCIWKIYQPMLCGALQTTTISYIVESNVTIKVGCYTRHIYFLENTLV